MTPNTIQISDSKPNLKESTGFSSGGSATNTTPGSLGPGSIGNPGNHLEIPSNNNPNLLCVDMLNQRRGEFENLFLGYFASTGSLINFDC